MLILKRYDVTRTSHDNDGNGIARTATYFNNYHVPIRQIKYSIGGNSGNFVEACQTEYEYDISTDKRARTTAYSYPKVTTYSNNTNPPGGPSWSCLKVSSTEYNEYGNLLSGVSEIIVPGSELVRQATTTNEYITTSRNIQLVSTSVQRDEITRSEERTVNKPTEDGRALASTACFFLSGYSDDLKPWTQHSYEYDSQGRMTVDTLAWAPKASVPDGSLETVSNQMVYSYDNGTLSQTVYDGDKNATVIKYDMRMYAGPMISKTLPLGQTETFDYDNICRLIKHTDALGHAMTTTYTVGPRGRSESVASPGGYVKLTKYDALGREVEVLDNGDPTNPISSSANRLLRCQKYDYLSQLKESKNNLGLVTKYTVDALARPLEVTDPKQNVLRNEYDDVNLTITQDLNGDIRSVTQLDVRTDAVKVTIYPDSSDARATYLLETNNVYDGNGRPISTTLIQKPKSSGNPLTLEKVDVQYGPQSTVSSRTVTGSTSGTSDTVERYFTYDLFGNTYTWLKKTTYRDGRHYSVSGATNIYDKSNRPVVTINQLGQKEQHSYDANGWLSRTVRFDGSEVKLTCDDVGQFVETAYPSSSRAVCYNSDGRVFEVKEGEDTIKYDITLDGTLTKTTYSDGLTQVNTLDEYSRPVAQTDVFGVSRMIEYGSLGELRSRSCQQDTLTYKYGTANHHNGQCVSFDLVSRRSYSTTIEYDGFNRPRRTTTTNPDEKTVLDCTYTIDARDKTTNIVTRSTIAPELETDRTIDYDGLGQVVSDSCSSGGHDTTIYTYDGNSNVISTSVDGKTINMSYNKIDQRTDGRFAYDALGRLVTNDEGREYRFDDRDRLLSVQTESATSGFEYRSDNYLARRRGASDTVELYYNSGKINSLAVSKDENAAEKTSLFTGTKAVIASYTDEKTSEYFFDTLNSTTLLVGEDRNISIPYDAYGTANPSSPIKTASSFGFGQEFSDETSGLVYLRSRYYSPRMMGFISMDPNHQENRYAYCQGDPLNNLDPLGESWKSILGFIGLIVGTVVGAVFTMGVSAVVEAALGAAVSAFEVSEVVAATAASVIGVTSAAIGGAAGNILGGFISAAIRGDVGTSRYTGWNVLVDGVTGLAGGAAGKLVEPAAAAGMAAAKYGGKALSPLAQKALTNGITSAIDNGTQAIVRPLLQGEPINPLDVSRSMFIGFVSSAAFTAGAGKFKAEQSECSPRLLASARQFLGRVRGKVQASTMSEINIYDSSVTGLSFRYLSGHSSGVDADVSQLASLGVRSRFGTLSQEYEDLPPFLT